MHPAIGTITAFFDIARYGYALLANALLDAHAIKANRKAARYMPVNKKGVFLCSTPFSMGCCRLRS
jgi:hypothetical protein